MSFSSTHHHSRRAFTTSCKTLDHYKTLGLTPNATKAQIKSHYYQLSKRYHPDISSDPKSRDIFTRVSEAYAILVNDRDRRTYDRSLRQEKPREQPANHSEFMHARAAPTRGPRATYAWERGQRPRQTFYPRRERMSTEPPPKAGPVYTERVGRMNRAERRAEEAAREMDRLGGVSGLKRALQLIGLMGVSFAIIGSWRQI